MATALLSAPVVIRPAPAADVEVLAGVKHRVESTCYAHLGTPRALAHRLAARATPAYLLSLLERGDLLLTADQDGTALGLGAARFDPDGVHLHSTVVARPGRGIGRALAEARLRAAADRALVRVTADSILGATSAQARLLALGLLDTGRRSPSPTFPGTTLVHWSGDVRVALARAVRIPGPLSI